MKFLFCTKMASDMRVIGSFHVFENNKIKNIYITQVSFLCFVNASAASFMKKAVNFSAKHSIIAV